MSSWLTIKKDNDRIGSSFSPVPDQTFVDLWRFARLLYTQIFTHIPHVSSAHGSGRILHRVNFTPSGKITRMMIAILSCTRKSSLAIFSCITVNMCFFVCGQDGVPADMEHIQEQHCKDGIQVPTFTRLQCWSCFETQTPISCEFNGPASLWGCGISTVFQLLIGEKDYS